MPVTQVRWMVVSVAALHPYEQIPKRVTVSGSDGFSAGGSVAQLGHGTRF